MTEPAIMGKVLVTATIENLEDLWAAKKGTLKPDFTVTGAMRDEALRRLTARGVTVDKAEWEAGRHYVDRILDDRIARRAFGDSTWKRRDVREDAQLLKAMELLRRGRTTAELLALATPPTPRGND